MVISQLCFELEPIGGHFLLSNTPHVAWEKWFWICSNSKHSRDITRVTQSINILAKLGLIPNLKPLHPTEMGGPQELKWPRICSNLKHKSFHDDGQSNLNLSPARTQSTQRTQFRHFFTDWPFLLSISIFLGFYRPGQSPWISSTVRKRFHEFWQFHMKGEPKCLNLMYIS